MKTASRFRLFLLIVVLFLSGCFYRMEQQYPSFHDLENTHNLRDQGWFPDIAGPDGVHLREAHSLNDTESFGKFSYIDYRRIDSVLSNREIYSLVTSDSLNQFIKRFKSIQVPDWFLKKEDYSGKMMFRKQDMYFIQSKEDRTIYFAYKPY